MCITPDRQKQDSDTFKYMKIYINICQKEAVLLVKGYDE